MSEKSKYAYIPPLEWHALTPFYDAFCTLVGLGKRFREKILSAVPLKEEQTVVDIGCGTGVFLRVLREAHPSAHLIGVDPDAKALLIAARRLSYARPPVILHRAFAEALSLADNTADVCTSTLALHHMPDEIKKHAIQEMYRILKPGGYAVIADFGEYHGWFLKKALFFENVEYLKGNFSGLIPVYLREAGFCDIKIIDRHRYGIHIIIGRK